MAHTNQRLDRFDNVKVILMTFVVIAHTLLNSYGDKSAAIIRFICLTYTMPMFFVISGYFAKSTEKSEAFKKAVKHLLIPCIVFSIINNRIMAMVNPWFHVRYDIAGFAMWYLWALFLYKITWPFMRKVPYILTISVLLYFIAALFPDIFSTRFSLNRLMSFYQFFVLGAILRERRVDMQRNVKINKILLTGGGVILYILSLIGLYQYPQITYQTAFNQSFQGSICMGLAIRGFLLVYIGFTGLMFWFALPAGKVWFTKYGSRTLTVYLWHGCIVLPFVFLVFRPFGEEDLFGKIMMVMIPTLLCVPLYCKPLNKFTQKYF